MKKKDCYPTLLEQQAMAEIIFHVKLMNLRINIAMDHDPERYQNELFDLLLQFVEDAGFGKISESVKEVSRFIGERGY